MRSSPDTISSIPLTTFFLFCIILAVLDAACISLKTSKLCPSFRSAQFEQTLEQYPFLKELQSAKDFDQSLRLYIEQEFNQKRFTEQFSCTRYDVSSSYYARFTTTVLCSSIIQLSLATCATTLQVVSTVCASTCAEYAQSEALILHSQQCGLDLTPSILELVRADYNLCTTPSSAYESPLCVDGLDNEPDRCGFASNTEQLCGFCTSGTANTTNSCCQAIGPTTCQGVPIQPFVPNVIDPETSAPTGGLKALSSGLIALIVLAGLFGISGAISMFIIFCWRRRETRSLCDPLAPSDHNTNAPNRESQYMSLTSTTSPLDQAVSNYRDEPKNDRGDIVIMPRTISSTSPTSGDEPSSKSPGPSRIGFYDIGPVVNRSEISLSASSGMTDRPISFVDQYSGQRISVGSIVRCIHDYDLVLPDELDIRRGDVIKVTQVFDDRWCKGVIIAPDQGQGDDRNKQSSDEESMVSKAFPIVCVCAASHDSGIINTAPLSSSGGRSTPGLRSIGGGRDSPVLTSVPEELKDSNGAGPRASDESGGQIQSMHHLPKKTSISRFKEHVGVVD